MMSTKFSGLVSLARGTARLASLAGGTARLGWLLAGAACLGEVALSTQLFACTTKDAAEKDVADASARRTLLKHLGEGVILQTYEDFVTKAEALDEAVAAYADAHDEVTLAKAQDAFREAQLVWERAEVFQLGPAADQTNFNPGSEGLRSEIYPWDDVRPCVVDHGLVTKAYESDTFADDVYPYARGLSALERLLFDRSEKTACEANDRVATPAAWQALVDSDLTQRRAAYAARCSEVVLTRARDLVKVFRDDFLPELSQAGAGSKLFSRTQEALNALTNSLFYMDYEARDLKLGGPLGYTMDCMNTLCPTELPYAKLSKEALKQNLLGLRAIFQGNAPEDRGDEMWGLADLLGSVGAETLADSVDSAIEDALTALEAVEPSLDDASRAPGSAMAKAFDALQALVDLLKTEFLQKLALREPMRASGDND